MLAILCAYLSMVYAPLAAALVEMFPARARYTALSFPYHVGNGIFGGFYSAVAFAMVTKTGDIYFGLWYPVVFAAVSVVAISMTSRAPSSISMRSAITRPPMYSGCWSMNRRSLGSGRGATRSPLTR
jgi:hypothetical protein